MQTALTDLLGIAAPIIQAPMAGGVTTPELVAAVSNAGGLGSFGFAFDQPEEIRDALARARTLTTKPINANLFLYDLPHEPKPDDFHAAVEALQPFWRDLGVEPPQRIEPPYAPNVSEQIEAVLAASPALVSFHLSAPPRDLVKEVNKRGAKVAASATTVSEAVALADVGCDVIVAQGSEAGGHRGTFLSRSEDAMIGTMALVRQIAVALPKIPVVAAGGIMDGAGLAAALALGAAGAQFGTAFIACPESGAQPAHKALLPVSASESTTIVKAFSGRPARALRNAFVERDEERPFPLLPFPIQYKMTGALRRSNALGVQAMWSGQACPLSRAVPAGALVELIVEECLRSLALLNEMKM